MSELYGKVREMPQNENTPFYPRSPYGVARALCRLDHGQLPRGLRHACLERHPIHQMKHWLLIFVLWLLPVASGAQGNTIAFSFTIRGQDTKTSAGVYSADTLIKTLWGNVPYHPGTYTMVWDGKTDRGTAAPRGQNYTIKLLTDSVIYNYDGKIGTTSQSWYSPNRLEDFVWQGNSTLAFAGRIGWFSGEYAEGKFNIGYFSDAAPNDLRPISPNYMNQTIEIGDMATDGKRLYLMNTSNGWGGPEYVTVLDAASGAPVSFTSGTPLQGTTCAAWPTNNCGTNLNPGAWWNTTLSYIDYAKWGTANPATGIAVQRNGHILAVAHGGANTIRLYDKNTGISLGSITGIDNATQMAFSSEGLWVAAGGALYLITGVGSTDTVTKPLTGFSNVVAVGTNGSTNSLFVLDGGIHQQMYEYAARTHALKRTYGTLGGYNHCNPKVNTNALMLDQSATTGATKAYPVFVRVEDSDDVWIEDGGNAGRILHISPSNIYVNQILCTLPSYYVAVSETMPTRAFIGMLEYDLNYAKPLRPGDPSTKLGGDGAWTLAENWSICALGAHGSTSSTVNTFLTTERLSDGEVYAQIGDPGNNLHLFQLPLDGKSRMRDTEISWKNGAWRRMLRNGILSYSAVTGNPPDYTVTVYQAPLTGFDSNRNPRWGSYSAVVSATTDSANSSLRPSPGWGDEFSGPETTTDGYYPIYQAGTVIGTDNYPHLGAIASGHSTYAWTTMGEYTPDPSGEFSARGAPNYNGKWPGGHSFGGHNGIGYPHTEGKNIFVGYDGQYASWGDQFYHFWEDGLQVGQFGKNVPYPANIMAESHPGDAGNIARFATTTYNGDIYLYLADEAFAPMHRWHISNLNSIHEFSGSGVLGPNGRATLTRLF